MPNRNDEIRARLAQRLKELGRDADYAWLASETDEGRGQVRKWLTGETDTFPATFAATLERVGVVSARWLLTGDGVPEVLPPDQAVVRLHVIGRLADEKLDPATVETIATILADARGEVAHTVQQAIEAAKAEIAARRAAASNGGGHS